MSCQKTEQYLRDNPGKNLPEDLKEHVSRCDDCSELWRETSSVENILRAFPQAELPHYLAAQARSRLEGRQNASIKKMFNPGWMSLAAPAMALVIAISALVLSYEYRPQRTDLARPGTRGQDNAKPLVPAVVQHNQISQIYPVWPGDQEVIESGDLAIMASLYPDNGGRVKLLLDGRDVSSLAVIDRQHVSYDPGSLEAGEHVVKVILQENDGSTRTASWSFYLLEEGS